MDVFKFGGASVNSAEGVMNFFKIVQSYKNESLIVVSAMGKTTNALEEIVDNFFNKKNDLVLKQFNELKTYHLDIINTLFAKTETASVSKVEKLFDELSAYLQKPASLNYEFEYDQIVAYGELLSTKIISEYLKYKGVNNHWVDIRRYLKTNDTFGEAKIDWELSRQLLPHAFTFQDTFIYITQGFIGGTSSNLTTTLGREGSDYTAAILANILDARQVSIWKDVPGVMNADPKWIPEAKQLKRISYQEAIELAFFGAKVIHPKTIQPLREKNIPMYVKSFINYFDQGTLVSETSIEKTGKIPIFIQKEKQRLISIRPKDYSFIIEENLGPIFSLIAKYRLKVNLTQNSAISFSLCVDNNKKIDKLIEALNVDYEVRYNDNLELITIRHYDTNSILQMTEGRSILLEQKSRDTAQFVLECNA
ncbi:aspartate kinase [Ancylomarina salipaludis]|uniref:Aspartokinase n=1 Tax=Ancylomarina salipaludis TaxID=2501299 RepID=A0A4Q1JJD5_9BACT|nr:aspartate kinase [Ancylomarina salipaludis]RXQ89885.1 aspartate kinase [Ancylomarina salipaludis]